MIHYHGLPITPNSAALKVIQGGHAFVSFNRPDQLAMAIEHCQSFAVDNGAFSSWKSGNPVADWTGFYHWVHGICRSSAFDFAVIPDVIDGTEADNDALLAEWPWAYSPVGAPVWHMHESLDRLERLANSYYRVCLGSSGQYATVGNANWKAHMLEVMDVVTDSDGFSICKLHGLRMLNPRIFTLYPFSSADSTNIARNVGIDSKWKGGYPPVSKDMRAMVMRERIEAHQSPQRWARNSIEDLLTI